METALLLLIVGMITVFTGLFLVVFIGNTIIKFTNRFIQPEIAKPVVSRTSNNAIDSKKLQAIEIAVKQALNGKANVLKVERI